MPPNSLDPSDIATVTSNSRRKVASLNQAEPRPDVCGGAVRNCWRFEYEAACQPKHTCGGCRVGAVGAILSFPFSCFRFSHLALRHAALQYQSKHYIIVFIAFNYADLATMAPIEITEDYYAVLKISRTATLAEIRKSYLLLARTEHPDKNSGNPKASDAFVLV